MPNVSNVRDGRENKRKANAKRGQRNRLMKANQAVKEANKNQTQ
jgi:hypothetical protein